MGADIGRSTDVGPRSRRAVVAGATLALVMAACVEQAERAGGSSTEPPAASAQNQVVDDAQISGQSSTSAAAREMPTIVLERRDVPREHGSVWLHAVAADEQRIVVVGGVADDFLADAAVWLSPDGATWSRVAHDELVFGDDASAGSMESNQYMADVVVGTFGIVAVGIDGRPPEFDAAAWVSTDGINWRRSGRTAPSLTGPGAQVMRSVVHIGDRFVAVGESAERAAIWVSDDGLEWDMAAIRGAPGDGPEMPSALRDIAMGGPGLVAVGSVGLEPRPAVWVSADGVSWDRLRDGLLSGGSGVEDADALVGRMMSSAVGDRLICVASLGDPGWPSFGRPSMWASGDGVEWIRTDARFDDTPIAATPAVSALTVDDGLVVAVGGYEGTDRAWSPGLAVLWISGDGGYTWGVAAEAEVGVWSFGPLAYPEGAADVARFADGFVVVGNDARPTGEEINGYPQYVDSGAIWIATIVDE
jgi:hypothetical protein